MARPCTARACQREEHSVVTSQHTLAVRASVVGLVGGSCGLRRCLPPPAAVLFGRFRTATKLFVPSFGRDCDNRESERDLVSPPPARGQHAPTQLRSVYVELYPRDSAFTLFAPFNRLLIRVFSSNTLKTIKKSLQKRTD